MVAGFSCQKFISANLRKSRVAQLANENHGLALGSKEWLIVPDNTVTGWWQLKDFYFDQYLGGWSRWTNIFQMGWNHQLGSLVWYVGGIFLFLGWITLYLHMIIRCRQPPKQMFKKNKRGAILRIQLMVQKYCTSWYVLFSNLRKSLDFHPAAFPEASLPSVSCDFCGGHGASSSTQPSCLLGSLEFWRRQFTLKTVRNRFFLWRPSYCEAFFFGEVCVKRDLHLFFWWKLGLQSGKLTCSNREWTTWRLVSHSQWGIFHLLC